MANVSSSNGLEKRPKLRFPGFDEPWISQQFSCVFSFLQNNTLSRAELDSDGEVLNIHYGDVLIKFGSILDCNDKDIPHIASRHESQNYQYLQNGDIIIADTAEDETVGKATELVNVSGRKVEAGLHTIPCRPLSCFASMYLGYYMNTPHFHRQLIPLMQGIKVLSISKGNIAKTKICAPKSMLEQQKISYLLNVLDRRTAAQRKVIEVLKKYKRGLLRDIFSKLNVRHDKRKLKDVAVLFADGDWIESKDQAPEGIRLVQTGNVGFGVYLDKPQNAKYISEATFHRLNCLEIYDGDILISRLPEPAGRACLLPQSTERRITAVDCTVIRTDKSVIDRTYLLQFLCSDQYLKTVNSLLAGGTRQRISRKNLEGIEVPYPSIDQQRYYGSFLCKVDARISNEENRLNCLSILRSSLLQQLFI